MQENRLGKVNAGFGGIRNPSSFRANVRETWN